MEKDDGYSDIYTYTCNHCNICICETCGGRNELYFMCNNENCYYCIRGHCYNNKSEKYCSTCYLHLDLKKSEYDSDSEI